MSKLRWEDVSPILVGEILSGDPEKDMVRNVELYLLVPTIKEYWLFDTREDPEQPARAERVPERPGLYAQVLVHRVLRIDAKTECH